MVSITVFGPWGEDIQEGESRKLTSRSRSLPSKEGAGGFLFIFPRTVVRDSDCVLGAYV